jgi:hypothetical protein
LAGIFRDVAGGASAIDLAAAAAYLERALSQGSVPQDATLHGLDSEQIEQLSAFFSSRDKVVSICTYFDVESSAAIDLPEFQVRRIAALRARRPTVRSCTAARSHSHTHTGPSRRPCTLRPPHGCQAISEHAFFTIDQDAASANATVSLPLPSVGGGGELAASRAAALNTPAARYAATPLPHLTKYNALLGLPQTASAAAPMSSRVHVSRSGSIMINGPTMTARAAPPSATTKSRLMAAFGSAMPAPQALLSGSPAYSGAASGDVAAPRAAPLAPTPAMARRPTLPVAPLSPPARAPAMNVRRSRHGSVTISPAVLKEAADSLRSTASPAASPNSPPPRRAQRSASGGIDPATPGARAMDVRRNRHGSVSITPRSFSQLSTPTRTHISSLSTELEVTRAGASTARVEISALHRGASEQREALATMYDELEAARQRLRAAEEVQRVAALSSAQSATLRAEITTLTAALGEAQQQAARAEQQNATYFEKMTEIRAKVAAGFLRFQEEKTEVAAAAAAEVDALKKAGAAAEGDRAEEVAALKRRIMALKHDVERAQKDHGHQVRRLSMSAQSQESALAVARAALNHTRRTSMSSIASLKEQQHGRIVATAVRSTAQTLVAHAVGLAMMRSAVSVLLCTVTLHANLAHSLTRSP